MSARKVRRSTRDPYTQELHDLKVKRIQSNRVSNPSINADEEGTESHKNDEGHDEHHDSNMIMPFYSPPKQLQFWGDEQIAPHVEWGNLFYDLTYVSAAYNCGALLMSSLTPELWGRGLLYFIGLFGSLYNMFDNKLLYDARYTDRDYVHRVAAIVECLFPAAAVMMISSSLTIMPYHMDEFSLFVLLDAVAHVLMYVELYCYGKGDTEAIRNQSKAIILYRYLPMIAFSAAAFAVGLKIHKDHEKDSYTYKGDSNEHRYLASSSTDETSSGLSYSYNDLPITLLFIYYVLNIIISTIRRGYILPKSNFRKFDVPANIDFMIHRYGEFTMLMLGESILSLLIVDAVPGSSDYWLIFWFGLVTVCLIQSIKFGSEPDHADDHSLWHGMAKGYYYNVLIQFFSFALIAFGITFKAHLQKVVQEESYDHRRASELPISRELAGYVKVSENAINSTYCGSLAIILLLIELMMNTHKGSVKDLLSSGPVTLLFVLVRLVIVVVVATLSQWLEDGPIVIISGFCCVVAYCFAMLFSFRYDHRQMASSWCNEKCSVNNGQ